MRRLFIWIALMTIVVLALTACSKIPPTEGFTDLIGQIKKDPQAFKDQSVTLAGYFRAQDAFDEIKPGFPPTDRLKDWAIKDNSGAIYIAASNLMPFSATSQDIWRVMRVTGTVRLLDAGSNGMLPYVEPQKIEWLGDHYDYDVLPASCQIAIHRFGGADQLDHHIYIFETRDIVVYDNKEHWRGSVKLGQTEWDELQKAFKQTQFSGLAATTGEACKGCIRYHVAALDAKLQTPHYVMSYEGSVPEKLNLFIKQVIEKTGRAKEMRQTLF